MRDKYSPDPGPGRRCSTGESAPDALGHEVAIPAGGRRLAAGHGAVSGAFEACILRVPASSSAGSHGSIP